MNNGKRGNIYITEGKGTSHDEGKSESSKIRKQSGGQKTHCLNSERGQLTNEMVDRWKMVDSMAFRRGYCSKEPVLMMNWLAGR